MIHTMTSISGWCTFLVASFTLAQPILLHRTHINEIQYLKNNTKGKQNIQKDLILLALACTFISVDVCSGWIVWLRERTGWGTGFIV